jgi:lipopolysaccharide transport system ATP-binding protein
MTAPICVTGLCKHFRRRHRNRPSTLKEAIATRLRHLRSSEEFLALDHIDLEVGRGEIVGVIGRNGAGKSTLLRLIGGVGVPDSGRITVHGRTGALLELGAGFHPELTGRENIFINGVVSGLRRSEVAARFDDIVAFAELEDFIDNPLRTYSSGMQLRLAFSISVHTDPDILLIDEVLAVGDLAFQSKCLERIEYFRNNGCAILIVSHDIGQIGNVCDRVVWLQKGRVAASGDPQAVTGQYEQAMIEETERRRASGVAGQADSEVLPPGQSRKGTREMEIAEVNIQDAEGHPITGIARGNALAISIVCTATEPIVSPVFSLSISDADGRILIDSNTEGLDIPDIEQRVLIRVLLDSIDLPGGDYFLDLGVYEKDWACVYDYHWHMHPLRIHEVNEHTPHNKTRWEFIPGGAD